jgi:hypothetical protein
VPDGELLICQGDCCDPRTGGHQPKRFCNLSNERPKFVGEWNAVNSAAERTNRQAPLDCEDKGALAPISQSSGVPACHARHERGWHSWRRESIDEGCHEPSVPTVSATLQLAVRRSAVVLLEDMRTMQFHANYVSASLDGDYYTAMFAEEDADHFDRPYLIIQRQFEDLEDATCYVETYNREYSGHFLVRRVEFTPESLLLEFDRANDNLIRVTFRMPPAEFVKASEVIKIISGEIEPEPE